MCYIENADYFVRYVDLPLEIGGMISPNDDGTFSIYLNSRRTHDQNIDDYIHELDHIKNDDFYNDKSIEEIEHL